MGFKTDFASKYVFVMCFPPFAGLAVLKFQLQLVKIPVEVMAKIGAKFSGKLLVGRFWLIFQPACMLAAQTRSPSNPCLGKISLLVFAVYL